MLRQSNAAAVQEALTAPGAIAIACRDQEDESSFTAILLVSYRVPWTGDLPTNGCNTLAVTNISGPGGWLQILDPDSFHQPHRFCGVQTPP